MSHRSPGDEAALLVAVAITVSCVVVLIIRRVLAPRPPPPARPPAPVGPEPSPPAPTDAPRSRPAVDAVVRTHFRDAEGYVALRNPTTGGDLVVWARAEAATDALEPDDRCTVVAHVGGRAPAVVVRRASGTEVGEAR